MLPVKKQVVVRMSGEQDSTRTDQTVEIEEEALDAVFSRLESGMNSAETYHSHDEVRPSGVGMARDLKIAYEELVRAHPRYELKRDNDE